MPPAPPFPGQRDVRELDRERRAAGQPTFEEMQTRRWGPQSQWQQQQQQQCQQQPQQQQQQQQQPQQQQAHWQSGAYEQDWSAAAGGTSWGGQRPFASPSPQRTQSELEGRRDWARTSGYDPDKDRSKVPTGVRAYDTIRPNMVDNLWELANDFRNYKWNEWTQVNCMTIGYERAALNPNTPVQWTCEWVDEKKWFKRIGPVAEVDKIRNNGGVIAVSPQEFALIPRRVTISAPVKDWVLEEHQDHLTVRDPDVMEQQLVKLRAHLTEVEAFVAALIEHSSTREQPPPPPVQGSSGARSSGYQ